MKKVPGQGVVVRSAPGGGSRRRSWRRWRRQRQAAYSVGWIDGTARGRSLGRGISRDRGSPTPMAGCRAPPARRLRVPFDLSECRAECAGAYALFNELYFRKAPVAGAQRCVRRPTPNSSILSMQLRDWNRIYGRRGFYQFQNVLPFRRRCEAALRELLEVITASRRASFLAVLKRLGPGIGPAGPLSFPMAGYHAGAGFSGLPRDRGRCTRRLVGITLAGMAGVSIWRRMRCWMRRGVSRDVSALARVCRSCWREIDPKRHGCSRICRGGCGLHERAIDARPPNARCVMRRCCSPLSAPLGWFFFWADFPPGHAGPGLDGVRYRRVQLVAPGAGLRDARSMGRALSPPC